MKRIVVSDELVEQLASDYHLNSIQLTFEQFLEAELVKLKKIIMWYPEGQS